MDYYLNSRGNLDCNWEIFVNGYYLKSGRNLITGFSTPIVTAKKGNFIKVSSGNVIIALKNATSSQKDYYESGRQLLDGSLLINVNYVPFEKFTFSSAYPFPGTYQINLRMDAKNLTIASKAMTVPQCK